jgi:hypothetical protein
MNLRIQVSTLVSGSTELDMDEENNTGMMAHSMRVIGEIIWLMVKVG